MIEEGGGFIQSVANLDVGRSTGRPTFRKSGRRPFVIAFFIWTGDHRARLKKLLDQELMSTCRTFFRYRFICRREFAVWIIAATVKSIPLACALFNQLAVRAQRALYTDKVLLHVLALWISAARSELTKTSMTDHHVTAALGANLIQRNIGNLFPLIQPPSSFAVWISGARHELPEASSL